jgi:hypothetical protein
MSAMTLVQLILAVWVGWEALMYLTFQRRFMGGPLDVLSFSLGTTAAAHLGLLTAPLHWALYGLLLTFVWQLVMWHGEDEDQDHEDASTEPNKEEQHNEQADENTQTPDR